MSLKITRLYLKNVKYIYTAMDKYEVTLDLSENDKLINILIGKMGSGKTTILGMLQPWNNFGTLDQRNQDGMYIDGKDGVKEIEYQRDDDHFFIHHDGIWNERTKSHSIKSYIRKNGEELNPNGNQGSFNVIIEYEFGITPAHLRLLRIGMNVTNIIKMKSTERKAYLTILLQDGDFYNMLNKAWNSELRELNTKSNLLSSKLTSIGIEKEKELLDEYELNGDEIDELSRKIEDISHRITKMRVENDNITKGISITEYLKSIDEYNELVNDIDSKIQSIESEINEFVVDGRIPDEKSIQNTKLELTAQAAKLGQQKTSNSEYILKLSEKVKDIDTAINQIEDTICMKNNDEHINVLKSTYNDLCKQDKYYQELLKDFRCEYSLNFLTTFISDLQSIDMIINDLCNRNIEDVKRIYNSDNSVVKWAQNKVDILTATRIKTHKEMSNIKFSETYQIQDLMVLPPFCPTKTCPYYRSHPFTIQKENGDIKVDDKVAQLKQKIEMLDIEIYRYSDYSYIYTKVKLLKELYSKALPIVKKLDALNSSNMLLTLSNLSYRKWYSYDKIVSYIELCEKREKHYELSESIKQIRDELSRLEITDMDKLESKLTSFKEEKESMILEIHDIEEKNANITLEIENMEERLVQLGNLFITLEKLDSLRNERKEKFEKVSTMVRNYEDIIKCNDTLIAKLQSEKLIPFKERFESLKKRNDSIKMVLNDLKFTKAELESLSKDIYYMTYLAKASSSKEGIPLFMIKKFLSNVKDIVNDLIYDILDDDIEICDFVLTETEFRIPYMKNGVVIDDISKGSQGQSGVISLAISFALVQVSPFDYNIMLLDEPDSPFYKKERNKFPPLLFKHAKAIGAKQLFLITHYSNSFEGYPINIITTSDEIVDKSNNNTIMRL